VWWISVEDRDPWCLVGDDAIHLLPQLPGGGGVGRLRRLRLGWRACRREDRRTRRSCWCWWGPRKRAAGQVGEKEIRCAGHVGAPIKPADLDLAMEVAGHTEEPAGRHYAQVCPLSQLPEQLDEIGADRFIPHGPHGHPARSWCGTL